MLLYVGAKKRVEIALPQVSLCLGMLRTPAVVFCAV